MHANHRVMTDKCGARSSEFGVPDAAPFYDGHSSFAIRHSSFRRGFTLVEMLVVITIIGILASLAGVATFKALEAAKKANIKAEMTNLASAMEQFKMQYGDYPPSDLSTNNSAGIQRFLAKAFPRANTDPTDNT